MSYELSRYNKYDVLRPNWIFWLLTLFLCRHVFSLFLLAFSKSGVGSKGGGASKDAIDLSNLFTLIDPYFIVSDVPALVLIYVLGARVPKSGASVRWLWARGRGLILLAIALYVATFAYTTVPNISDVDVVSLIVMVINIAVAGYVMRSKYLRDLFREFPSPEP